MTAPLHGKTLPQLRPELELVRGAAGPGGEPTWLVHDPLANRFLHIDVATYETLRHWNAVSTRAELLARLETEGRVKVEPEALERLIAFLNASRLTVSASRDDWRQFAKEKTAREASPLAALVHGYLFFKIPLFKPQAFLVRTLPIARALASAPVRWLIALLGVLGIYLASREWDAFAATLVSTATWEGAVAAAIALIVVKAAHELGHAYVTVAHGCRVHSMGIAFVVMAPLPYTDVTDSWRLQERRQRLMIDGAGIAVELAIACVALFLWAFLPDGPARGVAFTLSAVSLVSSLAINLNPFMRFDGYYLLSEAIGVENLHSRSFALARWKLREWLFALGAPAPEQFSRSMTQLLIAYGFLVWIYRLVLYVGIAVLVYFYFFKVLGIILFCVEMIYFVAKPIAHEIGIWMRNHRRILSSKRTYATAGVFMLLLAGACVPLSSRVEIPALLESARVQPIHVSRPARVAEVSVRQGEQVRAGDIIAKLTSPDIEQEIEETRLRLALLRMQHGRRAADANDRAASIVLESSLISLSTKLEGLEKEREELVLRAPFDGRIAEFDAELKPGRWVNPKEPIAVLAGEKGLSARGYVSESDMWRIWQGASGTFVPEMPSRSSVPVRIDMIAVSAAADIDVADLTSVHSGRITVTVDETRRLVPSSAQYLVRMQAEGEAASDLAVRGVVLAQGKAESLLARTWRQTLKVLLREAGA